jgi:hypothetical protein
MLTSIVMGKMDLLPKEAYKLQPKTRIPLPNEAMIRMANEALQNLPTADQLLASKAQMFARPDLSPEGPGNVMREAKKWVDQQFTKEQIMQAAQ